MKSLLHMHMDETKYCFVCGTENPNGLKLEPYAEDNRAVIASYTAPDYLCSYKFQDGSGAKAPVHGGILCALLDCLSAWVFFYLRKKLMVTIELNVRLLNPVFVGEKMYLRAEIISEKDDSFIVKGEIRNSEKDLCTVSEIKYKVLNENLMEKFTRD